MPPGLPTVDVVWLIRASGGLLVEWGALHTYGHLDVIDETVFDMTAIHGARMTLVIAKGTLPGLREGHMVKVGGTEYEVRVEPRPQADETLLILLGNA